MLALCIHTVLIEFSFAKFGFWPGFHFDRRFSQVFFFLLFFYKYVMIHTAHTNIVSNDEYKDI